MKHSLAFVDPRTTLAITRATPSQGRYFYPGTPIEDVFDAICSRALAERCACGATGAHTLCPLQPLTPELRNAAL